MRGEKAKSFEFPKVRFMERTDLQLSDAHWGHEPAPSPLNGERAGVRGEKAKSFEFPKVRFMGSWHLLVHANWGLEPKSNVAAEVTRL